VRRGGRCVGAQVTKVEGIADLKGRVNWEQRSDICLRRLTPNNILGYSDGLQAGHRDLFN
jgi:hypothetical protein